MAFLRRINKWLYDTTVILMENNSIFYIINIIIIEAVIQGKTNEQIGILYFFINKE